MRGDAGKVFLWADELNEDEKDDQGDEDFTNHGGKIKKAIE